MPILPDDDLPDTDEDEALVNPNDYFTTPEGTEVPSAYAQTALAPKATDPAPTPVPAKPPTGVKPSQASRSQELLERANALAARQQRPPTIMDGILAGLSEKSSQPVSSHGGTAMAQGFITGLTGGVKGRKAQDNSKEQFDQTIKLYEAERKLENDGEANADRKRRTDAYEYSVHNPRQAAGQRPMHQLQAERLVRQNVAAKRKELGLDLDDEEMLTSRKMPPEIRAQREKLLAEYEAEQKRLAISGGLQAPPTAVTTPPRTTPAPAATDPVPAPQAKTEPLPPGVSMADATVATQEALAKARASGNKAAEAKVLDRARRWGIPLN
jgi:hypothetical protein